MQYNFRGKYDSNEDYFVKDVVSYQATSNDPIKYYFCINIHDGASHVTPTQNGDNGTWCVINTLSNFPNSVDTFIYRSNVLGSDKINIARINELTLKTSLTASEQDELNYLIASNRNKLFLAEDLNAIQDSLSNLQMFFKDKVEASLNNTLIALENKKNSLDLYLDSTTAGALRQDLGVMADLITNNRTSLVNAINELKSGNFSFKQTSVTDVNSVIDSGYYRLSTYTTNAPDSNSGVLVVFNADKDGFLTRAQMYFSFGYMYYRTNNGSNWGSWITINRPSITWVSLTLQNGAIAVNGSPVRYTIDGKRVTVEGQILTIANGTVIATLPSGYRPPVARIFKTALNYSTTNDGATIIVNTDGTIVVQVTGNTTNQISLMGVSFYVD